MIIHHKNLLHHQLHPITILQLLPQHIKLYDNQMIKTPQTDIPIDRSRHPSQDQPNLLPPSIDRTTKTHFILRHQPKMDYRFFYNAFNTSKIIIHSTGSMRTSR